MAPSTVLQHLSYSLSPICGFNFIVSSPSRATTQPADPILLGTPVRVPLPRQLTT